MKTSNHREITNIICEYFNIKKEDLFSKTRKREVVVIRQLNYYMIRKFTNLSLQEIGNQTTGAEYNFKQDHSTIIHSINTVSGLRRFDKEVELKCVSIESLINVFIKTGDIEFIKVILIKKIKNAGNINDLIKLSEGQKTLIENIKLQENESKS
jgi:hypothetical protein